MEKKAQSISINTIVVAVIALLVLIVVIFIFSRQTGKFAKDTNNCESLGGKCFPAETCDEGWVKLPGEDLCKNYGEDYICCKNLFGEEES